MTPNIPTNLQWSEPVFAELMSQYESGTSEFALAESNARLVEDHLTYDAVVAFRSWMSELSNEDAWPYSMGFIALDELGYLDRAWPPLDYSFWVRELSSPVWGDVRGAAMQIASDHIHMLHEDDKSSLHKHIQRILQSSENPSVKLWLSWLGCQLGFDTASCSALLRSAVVDTSPEMIEAYDIREDACTAIARSHYSTTADLEVVWNVLVNTGLETDERAVILEEVLGSDSIPGSFKERAIKFARNSGDDELLGVAREHRRVG